MMGQMSLEGSGDNGRGRKRGALSIQFVEKHTKPAGMESKKGLPSIAFRTCTEFKTLINLQNIASIKFV